MTKRLTAEEKAQREVHKNMHYCGSTPTKVPEGRFLHHNHVMHTINMPVGLNGFRAWTYPSVMDGFAKCPCGWSGLPHYAAKDHISATKGKAETAEHFAARMGFDVDAA
jgi:hypothetical protein